MGGHGGLNILPQKRWHLYRHDNRLRVQRDEERHREEESRQRQQQEQKSMSDILTLLKRRKVEATMNVSKQVTTDSSIPEETSHRTDPLSSTITTSQRGGVHTPPQSTSAVSTTLSDSLSSSSSISELPSSSSSLHTRLFSSSFSHSSTASSLPSTSTTFSSSLSSASTRRLSPSPHSNHTSSSSSSSFSFSSSAIPASSSSSSLSSSRKKNSSTSSSSPSQFPETFSGGESLGGFLGDHEEEVICGGLLPLDDEDPNSLHREEEHPQVYPQVSTVGKIIRIRSIPSSSSSSSFTSREETNHSASSTATAQSGGRPFSQSIPKASWMKDLPSSAFSFSRVTGTGMGSGGTIGQSHSSSSTSSSKKKGSSFQSGGGPRHINFFAEEEKELEKLEAKRQKYLQEAGYTPNAQSDFDQIIRVSLHQKPWYHCPPSGASSHRSQPSSSFSSRQNDMKIADSRSEEEREKLLQLRRIEASAVVANLLEEKRLQIMSGEKESLNKFHSQKEGEESQVLSSRLGRRGSAGGGIVPGVCTSGMTMKGMIFEEEDHDGIDKVDLLSVEVQGKQQNDLEEEKKKKKEENAGDKEKKMKDKKKEKRKKDKKRRKEKSRTSVAKDEERRRRGRRRSGHKEEEEDGGGGGDTSICLVIDDESSLATISDEFESSSSVYCEEDQEEEEERQICLTEDDALVELGRWENKRGEEKHRSTGMKKEEREEEEDQDDVLIVTEEKRDK